MFSWLKRNSREQTRLAEQFKEMLEPQILAVTVAEIVQEHALAVARQEVSVPSFKSKQASVREVWAGTRIEALGLLFGFGRSDPFLLADFRLQGQFAKLFLDDRVHLEFPQPRGQANVDTVQAIMQAYLYLSKIGTELADPMTDRLNSQTRDEDIIADLTDQLTNERSKFDSRYELAGRPQTLFEIVYADITKKTKSIAFSKVFGPMHESGIRFVVDLLTKEGHSTTEFEDQIARFRAASDPDSI